MKELYIQLRYVLPLWFVMLFTAWLPENKISFKIRGFLSRPFIKKAGINLQIGRDVTLLNTFNLEIGDNIYIAKGGWYNALGGLKIEDEVICGPYVVMSTLQHVFKDNSVRFGGSISGNIKIGKGVWLASYVSVKCGVTVGQGCIIASNTAVTKSTDDNKIYGGGDKFIKDNENRKASIYSKSDLFIPRK